MEWEPSVDDDGGRSKKDLEEQLHRTAVAVRDKIAHSLSRTYPAILDDSAEKVPLKEGNQFASSIVIPGCDRKVVTEQVTGFLDPTFLVCKTQLHALCTLYIHNLPTMVGADSNQSCSPLPNRRTCSCTQYTHEVVLSLD